MSLKEIEVGCLLFLVFHYERQFLLPHKYTTEKVKSSCIRYYNVMKINKDVFIILSVKFLFLDYLNKRKKRVPHQYKYCRLIYFSIQIIRKWLICER